MTEKQSTLDGGDGPSDDLIAVRTVVVDQLDCSRERAQSLVPDTIDSDRLRALTYIAEDRPDLFTAEVDGNTLFEGEVDALAVASLLWEEDGLSATELFRLSSFGDGVEDTPIEVLRVCAPAGSWGSQHYDPTDIRSIECGGCGDTFYDVVVPRHNEDTAPQRPWDESVPAEPMFVSGDGRKEEAAYPADDEAASPYYVRDEDDDGSYIACESCQDYAYDGRMVTLYYDGQMDQVMHSRRVTHHSYIREMVDADWMFMGPSWGREIRDSMVREDDPIHDSHWGDWARFNGLPSDLLMAVDERRLDVPYPIVWSHTSPEPEPRGGWQACHVPAVHVDHFEDVIDQYSDE